MVSDEGTGVAMADTSPPERPIFDPVDTSFDPNDVSARDDVESPSLSSSNALARFEFEPGKSKDGTKILMLEWVEEGTSAQGDWEISWEDKKTVYPSRDRPSGDGQEQPVNRLYFLLGPGVTIPTTVKLQKGTTTWKTNPLPAIFSPELGTTARQAGKKGVLHTIWAKKRLQVLQREIDNESRTNAEGIGLEMAVAEKEWIEQNFGVSAKPTQGTSAAYDATSPTSPKSPGGGRLMDKLRGLKLSTDSKDGTAKTGVKDHNPLSPETSDVAVGSFGSFAAIKGMPNPSSLAAKPAQPAQRRMAPAAPPESIAAQQQQGGGMGSLNALASSQPGGVASESDEVDDDDLFAIAMSPKAAEKGGSFSFGAQDTRTYLKGETA